MIFGIFHSTSQLLPTSDFQASINKLKREAAERGSREGSVLSDRDETESIGSNSDAFGDPLFQRERKR